MAEEALSPIFNQPSIAGFTFMRTGEKYPPIEEGWQKKGHSFEEAAAYQGNIGLMAGNGYIGLDQDKPEAFKGLILPETTTWETRPGRLGMWLTCNDRTPEVLAKYGKRADQAQIKLFDGREIVDGYHPQVGEVKLERTYQVIPPSWKKIEGQRVNYRMIEEITPAEISLDWLLSELLRIGIVFSEKPKDSRPKDNAKRLEGMKKEAADKRLHKTSKAKEFLFEAAMRAKPGHRNDTGFWLACQLRDLGLEAGETSEYMREYAKGLEDSESEPYTEKEAMESLRQAYSREPREAPRRQGNDRSDDLLSIPPPCDIYELLRAYKKWLYIEEDYNITGPVCGVVSNFCPGDPDILGLIGPSGSNKTEFIRSLGEHQNEYVYPVSSITEHTLVSGHKDSKDVIPQLKGRLLTIKDLTSILSRKEDVRAGIFADFRELTDGYIKKEFGNGISKEYKDIHSSILFASTNAIERYYSMYSNLGQRMIFLRPKNNPQKARERAFQNRNKQKEMREELHSTVYRFISSMKAQIDNQGLPSTPEAIQEEMGQFYDFLALARTTIHHDYRSGEIDELPEPEFPTRIANTVSRLCEVHALIYGRDEVGLEDADFGCRIILDNVPTMRWRILNVLSSEWQTTSAIAKKADLPSGSARYALEELFSLKLVERLTREEKDASFDKRSDSYRLSDRWSWIIEKLKTRIRGGSTIDESTLGHLFKLFNNQIISLSNPCLQSCEEEDSDSELQSGEPKHAEVDMSFAEIAKNAIIPKPIEPNDADTLKAPKGLSEITQNYTKPHSSQAMPAGLQAVILIKEDQNTSDHKACLVCGDPIGPGHGSYFARFCSSCGPAWSMVKAATKSLPPGFTVSQINEELAKRGRPPRKEYIPIMLRDLGYGEEGGNWKAIEANI